MENGVRLEEPRIRYYETLDTVNEAIFPDLSGKSLVSALTRHQVFRQAGTDCGYWVMHYLELEVRGLSGEGGAPIATPRIRKKAEENQTLRQEVKDAGRKFMEHQIHEASGKSSKPAGQGGAQKEVAKEAPEAPPQGKPAAETQAQGEAAAEAKALAKAAAQAGAQESAAAEAEAQVKAAAEAKAQAKAAAQAEAQGKAAAEAEAQVKAAAQAEAQAKAAAEGNAQAKGASETEAQPKAAAEAEARAKAPGEAEAGAKAKAAAAEGMAQKEAQEQLAASERKEKGQRGFEKWLRSLPLPVLQAAFDQIQFASLNKDECQAYVSHMEMIQTVQVCAKGEYRSGCVACSHEH
ncbi:unnamed protein product, partial [Prorocentrum cordatum]